ncbi:MAG: TonB-dependent receptor [Sphingomonadales bacterium]|nr:TonB-dependent receptor [Sphingomonadales bacterium]
MKIKYLLLAAACACPISAFAKDAKAADDTAPAAETPQAAKQVFSTGVAKGRDMLDSAISASSIESGEIEKLGARSLAEVLRNVPGIRAEAATGEGNASYSIRGLPLAATGSKFVQFQEDGLPVLEFGDLQSFAPDAFVRADLNLARIETIRGGSASTFGSNSPGGVINLMSKTGEVEGGAIRATAGLDYGEYRIDADYGGRLSDTLRFHFGGFYRRGEGPRTLGYDAYKGGQFKFNITKEFDGGYIRLNLKYLDDQVPYYQTVAVNVTGTNADPKFTEVTNLNPRSGSQMSNNIGNFLSLDQNNQRSQQDLREGMHPVVKSIGLESQFDVSDWTITEKFRYADISGRAFQSLPVQIGSAAGLAFAFGGPGASLSYASGPNRGQVISNPAALNGNGLLAMTVFVGAKVNSYDNLTNDLRASRVWDLGGGKLTTTIGYYKAAQSIDSYTAIELGLTDVRGDGKASLLNLSAGNGFPITQDGILQYSVGTGAFNSRSDVDYDVNAPYGSVNYHVGRIAVGGSLRYDFGHVNGSRFGADLGGGRVGAIPFDINGDGAISFPESAVSALPLSSPGPVDYRYHYLSYSAGVNYRIAESLAVFGRYSRGARAAADRILFTSAITPSGGLLSPADGYDSVRQAELGAKFRTANVTLNVTGFLAKTSERNLQLTANPDGSLRQDRIVRGYKAKGVEVEGSYRSGGFNLTANATWTDAQISSDAGNPAVVGNTPRHASSLIFSMTPQYETQLFTVGFNAIGTTSSYAQDTNQLKLPGYTLVNAFVQFRPVDRVQLMLNVNNLFDKTAFAEFSQASIPPGGIVLARALNGRTVSASLAFSF